MSEDQTPQNDDQNNISFIVCEEHIGKLLGVTKKDIGRDYNEVHAQYIMKKQKETESRKTLYKKIYENKVEDIANTICCNTNDSILDYFKISKNNTSFACIKFKTKEQFNDFIVKLKSFE
jgi:hypothetical protein